MTADPRVVPLQTLESLFAVLGESDAWTPDLVALVDLTERRWLGHEHGPGSGKKDRDAHTVEAAWPLLAELGLVEEVAPELGTSVGEIVVMGAAAIGMHRRIGLVRRYGVVAPRLTVLAGQRPHGGFARDGGLGELLSAAGRFGTGEDARRGRLAIQADLLASAGVDDLTAARVVLPTETDLARLLLVKHFPGAALESVVPAADVGGVVNELGPRDFSWEVWRGSSGMPELRLLNGAPVDRGEDADGRRRPARPTSSSTIDEWLDDLGDSFLGGPALFVVNQPHLHRVAVTIHSQVRRRRPDLEVIVCGAGAERGVTDVKAILGEIPLHVNAGVLEFSR